MALPVLFMIAMEEEERVLRLEKKRGIQRRRRFLRDASNPFEMKEKDFRDLFRLSRDLAHDICRTLKPLLHGLRTRIPEHLKVLAVLRNLATGEFQRSIGSDLALGQTTVSKYVRIVVPLIADHYRSLIQFPFTHKERMQISERFKEMSGFPGILGCIDCSHIRIRAPSAREEDFSNRRGQHSMNVQMICDSELKILNVKANFPGRVQDQFIWQSSLVKQEMERLHRERVGDFYLLGDSDYVAEPYLLTPIVNAVDGSPEQRYNDAHSRTRNTIQRTFGVLKARFRAISSSKLVAYEPAMVVHIVRCCAMLHNMCQASGMPLPSEKEIEECHTADNLVDAAFRIPNIEEIEEGDLAEDFVDDSFRMSQSNDEEMEETHSASEFVTTIECSPTNDEEEEASISSELVNATATRDHVIQQYFI